MNRNSWYLRAIVIACCLVPASQEIVGQTNATTKSSREGVYTEEQARRGEKITSEICVECHVTDFMATMLQSWAGTTANNLFDLMSTTMPEDNPGGLKPQQYADVLAYMLELNELPPGREELKGDKDALRRVLIELRQ